MDGCAWTLLRVLDKQTQSAAKNNEGDRTVTLIVDFEARNLRRVYKARGKTARRPSGSTVFMRWENGSLAYSCRCETRHSARHCGAASSDENIKWEFIRKPAPAEAEMCRKHIRDFLSESGDCGDGTENCRVGGTDTV